MSRWVYAVPVIAYVLAGDNEADWSAWRQVEVWAGPPATMPRPLPVYGPWLVAASCMRCDPKRGYICGRHR